VTIKVRTKASQVVLKEEDAEELRSAELDEHIPRRRNAEKDSDTERIKSTEQGAEVSLNSTEGD
jgi:hypothetical protein